MPPILPRYHAPQDNVAICKRLQASLANTQRISEQVNAIIANVKRNGDSALATYSRTFDNLNTAHTPFTLKVTQNERTHREVEEITAPRKAAIHQAITNIKAFHAKQTAHDVTWNGKHGEQLTLRSRPLEAVGLYVPGGSGGTTPLISTLIMNAIPAQLAGVKRIVVTTPPRTDGSLDPTLLYTLNALGLSEVYKVGGAQAIAALAYGTASILPVHFITGPGNAYVTEAKRQVFGTVGIESLAGNSELIILSDGSVAPEYVAADLLSQSEHAGYEMSALITTANEHAEKVMHAMATLYPKLARAAIIKQSLAKRSALILVDTLAAAYPLINALAPEHLELLVKNPHAHLAHIDHAGAIFLGKWSSQPLGDYIAGCNHILPTAGTARFASPLSVNHFRKQSNIIDYTPAAFAANAPHAAVLAEAETLSAHKYALDIRNSPNL